MRKTTDANLVGFPEATPRAGFFAKYCDWKITWRTLACSRPMPENFSFA